MRNPTLVFESLHDQQRKLLGVMIASGFISLIKVFAQQIAAALDQFLAFVRFRLADHLLISMAYTRLP